MELEDLANKVDDFITKGNPLEAFVILSLEVVDRIKNNTFEKLAHEFEIIYDKLSPYISDILNDFQFKIEHSLKMINELISVFPEVEPYMKKEDIEKFKEIVKEGNERIKLCEKTLRELEEFGENLSGEGLKEFSYISSFITVGYLELYSPMMLTVIQLLDIYENYMDYVPTHKMPVTFEQDKKEKYDDADDFLFIDDMDE